MSWGTSYTYEGYLSRVGKNELKRKKEDLKKINDRLWQEIIAYAAMTPPATMKTDDDVECPFPEFIADRLYLLREELENNITFLSRIEDCMEAMRENPESVIEG
jgi:hypothetical protein